MMNKIRNTDLGLLFLRLIMGLSIASHGYQKVFQGQVNMLSEGLVGMGFPMPTVFAWAAALSEFLGGLFIAFGFMTRLGALFVFIVMSVAFFGAHAHDPFQVKELAFLFWGCALCLIFTGAGRYSLDSIWCKPKNQY